jgi:signal transduction histidine kinase/ActR/RegA family two-component response regulator
MTTPRDDGTALRALRETELNFRHLAENVPGALFQYTQFDDGRSQVSYMSPRCLELWEVPPEVIEHDASVLWQMVHPADLPGMVASVQESARTMGPWYWEWRITTPSGARKWLQGSGRPMERGDGWVKWNSFILDVTARVQAEAAARDLRAQLQQAQQLEALGRLAGGIAHDVNNVLTVVMGFAESAMESLPDGTTARDDVAEVISAASRAAALTRQLLMFARRQPAEPVVFDPAERLEEGSLMLQRLLGEDILLEYDIAQGVPTVRLDPAQFDQAVTNLVLNARDAMPQGGRIAVCLRTSGAWVELSVTDEGVGMDEDTRARIFEPFFSTKALDRGTGLGLPTVHGVVTAAGGEIDVTSAPGAGSVFTIRLPATTAPVQAPVRSDAAAAAADLLPARVLVCEDDGQLRRVLERILRRHGVEVRAAELPAAALALVDDWIPDLLVTDVVTGGGGGVALARDLRARLGPLPVLFITGYVQDELSRHQLDLGRDEILHKPFRIASLFEAVRRVWRTARETRHTR